VSILYSNYSYISECNFIRNRRTTMGGSLGLSGSSYSDPINNVIRKSHFIENEGKILGGV
jgi:hypothetical protein